MPRLNIALTGICALVAALSWVLIDSRSANGDPGGRVLAQVAPVRSAIPTGLKIIGSHYWEPTMTSCDGDPKTKGWSPVVAQIDFSAQEPAAVLVLNVTKNLVGAGWSSIKYGTENDKPSVTLSKRLIHGRLARAHLSKDVVGDSWTLVAMAPPVGREASNC